MVKSGLKPPQNPQGPKKTEEMKELKEWLEAQRDESSRLGDVYLRNTTREMCVALSRAYTSVLEKIERLEQQDTPQPEQKADEGKGNDSEGDWSESFDRLEEMKRSEGVMYNGRWIEYPPEESSFLFSSNEDRDAWVKGNDAGGGY